jgi:3-oxoacyl-[acyl-carrier-protein] synthase-3
MNDVYITRVAKYMPNKVVYNEEMEEYLGLINSSSSKTKALILRNNKIVERYYALDIDGNTTHSNAELTANAVRELMKDNPIEIKEVDLLTCGTSSPDQLMPSHAVMVHGCLPESRNIEVVSPAGVCCAGMHAFKYAYLSVKSGDKKKAVASGSERFSGTLKSDQFEDEVQRLIEIEEKPIIAFEKDFLRWMLSDGAGAVLMENKPNEEGLSLKVEWVEGISFANDHEACMYMGAEKKEDTTLTSYKDYSPTDLISLSVLSIKQDVKILDKNILGLGFEYLKQVMDEKKLGSDEVDFFLPHISSYYFEDKIESYLISSGIPIKKDKWFLNLNKMGNVGAASIYLMLEELYHSGKLKKGHKVLLAVPESSRFSYVFSLLTVC